MFSDLTTTALAVAIPILMGASFVFGVVVGIAVRVRRASFDPKIIELAWNRGPVIRIEETADAG